MQPVLDTPTRPHHQRVDPGQIDRIDYIAHADEMQELAGRLQRNGYRGAICGPTGSGKSVMLHALGEELLNTHGLTPLPLHLDPNRVKALPPDWRRTIRKARHTDALLLDDYDQLPARARTWAWFASLRAGAVIVTSQKTTRYKTIARPKPTVQLLHLLLDRMLPVTGPVIDRAELFAQHDGNLRACLRDACEQFNANRSATSNSKKQAG